MESVKVALDGAKDASSQIHKQTFEASESAARALADLKEAGQQAAAAVRAAGMAARAEMDISERRASNASQALLEKTQSMEARVIESTGKKPVAQPIADLEPAPQPEPEPEPQPQKVVQSPSRAVEEDLFEASADRMAKALTSEEDDAGPTANGHNGSAEIILSSSDADVFEDAPDTEGERPAPPIVTTNSGNSLSDIIADMERDERSTLSREETAETLLDQLQESGIRLTDIFRPKDKKKIAFAARKGDKQRRSAISQHAGRQVERVRQRLRGNLELMTLARDFLALEEEDALNALENTHASNKNASPRLATYLLLDAAVT
ncbi:MAG: hypothetical protein VXW22_09955 [Pseudomonadota bacterium]|nr:hypothetical protein [Pseudomonadota bacterium]